LGIGIVLNEVADRFAGILKANITEDHHKNEGEGQADAAIKQTTAFLWGDRRN